MLDRPMPLLNLPRVLLSIGRVLPVLLTVLGLFLLEASTEVAPPEVQDVSPRPGLDGKPGRLVVFWVDSLSTLDMAVPDRLTRFKARLAGGLHGAVRPCMDAMSVPCFTAATTGNDRFSVFSLVRNFGGAGGVPEGSVLHAFKARGLRLGFIGDPQIGAAVQGFDHVEILPTPDDVGTVKRGLALLDSDAVDFLILHLRDPDEISHAQGPADPLYATAMETVDREMDAAIAHLRPEDTAIVFGDHGHTPDGQHFAGLDVPTYFAAFGPLFKRAADQPMAITDEAALWARPFGLRFGHTAWAEAYFSGAPLPSTGAPGELPPVSSGNAPLPLWAAALGALLAMLVALPYRGRWLFHRDWRALLLVLGGFGVTAFLLGATYMATRPVMYWRGPWINMGIGVVSGLLGLLLALPAMRLLRSRTGEALSTLAPGIFLAGTLALAMPTVYKYGGFYIGLTGFVAVGLVAAVAAVRRGERAQAALLLLMLVIAWRIWNPVVKNFALREFLLFIPGVPALQGVITLALAVLTLWLASKGRDRLPFLVAGGVGLLMAAFGPVLPPGVFILPCAVFFPLAVAAHRLPRLGPLLALVAPPATVFFLQFDVNRLLPVLCGLSAFPLWALTRGRASRLERGLGLIVLLWMMLWVMLGSRLAGLDFNYFFRWLAPGEPVEDTWAWNTLLTTTLYLALPVTGILLAKRAAPEALSGALIVAWHFTRVKLALVLLFILGFSVRCTDAGPFITADVIMEAGVWVVVLLFLLGLPLSPRPLTPVPTPDPTGA